MEDWNDGYITQGLDRVDTVICLLQDRLYSHPAIIKAGMQSQIEAIGCLMAGVYVEVGQLEDL